MGGAAAANKAAHDGSNIKHGCCGSRVAGIRGVGKARIVSGPFYSHFLVMKKLAIPALARALRERSSLTRC